MKSAEATLYQTEYDTHWEKGGILGAGIPQEGPPSHLGHPGSVLGEAAV